MKHLKEKKPSPKKLIILLLLAVLLIAPLGYVAAKYVFTDQPRWSQIHADEFYFTAALLGDTEMIVENQGLKFDDNSTAATWTVYGGSAHQISINIQNYYDQLRITEKAIQYKASVSVTDDPTGGESYSPGSDLNVHLKNSTASSGTLSGGSMTSAELILEIPSYASHHYDKNTVVTLLVKSNKPYTKTLTINIVLVADPPVLSYQIRDNVDSPYAELVLMSWADYPVGGGTVHPVTLVWPDYLSIDNSDPLTFNIVGGVFQQMPITVDAVATDKCSMLLSSPINNGQSESIYFFKDDLKQNYTRGITVVDEAADGSLTVDIYSALNP